MMQDITDRKDIVAVLEDFYAVAVKDPVIGYFFTEVVHLDMMHHIPVIAQFWETVLFGTAGYRNDVMAVHRRIHALEKIQKKHLDHWADLFLATIDRHYAGPNAERMKQRARSIATMMNIKLNHEGIAH